MVMTMPMLTVMMCKIQQERLLSSKSQGPAGPASADMHGDRQLSYPGDDYVRRLMHVFNHLPDETEGVHLS
jgi:hypothetical protein